MANVTLNNGEVYKFGKLNGNPVCTYGSDFSHADLKVKSDIQHGNPSSYTAIEENKYSKEKDDFDFFEGNILN